MLATNSSPDGSLTNYEKESKKRKVIPSCTIWAIRSSFPSENYEYTPFIESNDDEDSRRQLKLLLIL